MLDLAIKKFLEQYGYKSTSKVEKKGVSGESYNKTLKTALKEFCQYLEDKGGIKTKEFNDLVERVPGKFIKSAKDNHNVKIR